MRKIHCPECGQTMPATEHKCPKCGEPMTSDAIAKGRTVNRVANILVALVFVAIVTYSMWPDGDEQKAANPPTKAAATAQANKQTTQDEQTLVAKVHSYELHLESFADAPDYMFKRVVQTHVKRFNEGALAKKKLIRYVEEAAGAYQDAIHVFTDKVKIPKGLPEDVADMTKLLGKTTVRAWTARKESLEFLKAYIESQNPEDLDMAKKRMTEAVQLIKNSVHCYENALKKARAAQG